ncbi:MAG: hypothetical protein K1000chlam2_00298 [Chlamydiae bacterium]|nr:hypothetical protein [Chlamydiota bacterium]
MTEKADVSCFLEIPEKLTSQLTKQISELDDLVNQVSALKVVASPSLRVHTAFEFMLCLAKLNVACSVDSILKLHELIGKDGKIRGTENNIAIRGYHPAPAENLEEILNAYVNIYSPKRSCEHPFLKIGGAYLSFALIHPFRDGNGRIGRLIAAWLMYAHNYGVLAPYLEPWLGNENKQHGKTFESKIQSYLAWCNPLFSNDLISYVEHFFSAFLQELTNKCRGILEKP